MTALLSRRTIAKRFDLHCEPMGAAFQGPARDRDLLRRLRLVQIAGARHGRAGYYPDGDFSGDADWCYGIGAEIRALEEILDIDDGAVFDLYQDAHSAFFRDGTINPGDRDDGTCFHFQFGAVGTTNVYVWARSLEDGLELAAAYLADTGKAGHFVEPDYDDAAREIGVDLAQYTRGLADIFEADNDLASRIMGKAEVDLTYTESGYLASWEWFVSELDGPPGPSPRN